MSSPLPALTLLENRYRLITLIGEGGYGEVWKAEELLDGDSSRVLRHVAIKRLVAIHDRRRFDAEVAALCRLGHPNIVTVYQHGIAPEGPWVAMEYVEGAPLHLAAAGMDTPSRLRLLIAVCDALQHAHEAGVAHRDLKPQNVLVDTEGGVHVVDFGLAWSMARQEVASCRVGTPGYLAPELIETLADTEPHADHRVDLYSLGATMYATFAGHSPFAGHNNQITIHHQVRGTWTPERRVPSMLLPLITRCLEKDPRARPHTAGYVADQLREMLARHAESERNQMALPDHDARVDLVSHRWTERSTYTGRRGQEGLRLRASSHWSDDPDALPTGFFLERDAQGRRRYQWEALRAMPWDTPFHLLEGRVVERQQDGSRFVEVDYRTHVVLAPALPWSVSAVVRAVGLRNGPCASRHWANLRRDEAPSRALVVGNLAHRLLEVLLERATPSPGCSEEVDAVLAEGRWSLLACGIGASGLPRLKDELRAHVRPLLEWCREAARGRRAEVSYLSGRYGLAGRMDLAVEREDALEIVDLKTGRHISDEHKAQVNAYVAMATGSRPVRSSLWYSQLGQRVEVRAPDSEAIGRLMAARNALVLARRAFADGTTEADIPAWNEDPDRCMDSPCKYLRNACAAQCHVLGHQRGYLPFHLTQAATALPPGWTERDSELLDRARQWYWHFFRLLEREQLAGQEREGTPLRQETLSLRLESGVASLVTHLKRVRLQPRLVHVETDRASLLQVGDSVLLHDPEEVQGEMLRARVEAFSGRTMTLRLGHADLPRDTERLIGWVLEPEVSGSSQTVAHLALWRMMRHGDDDLLRLLLDAREVAPCSAAAPAPDETPILHAAASPNETPRLNPEQDEAVRWMTTTPAPRLVRVQGPPGTGKTAVIAEAVARLTSAGERVLVVALTHAAVDNLVARIVQRGVTSILRKGSMKRAASETLTRLSQGGVSPETVYSTEWGESASSLEALVDQLAQVQVVAMTAHAALQSDEMHALRRALGKEDAPPFDAVFVDEASQLIEPLAVGVLLLGRRGVLIGDEAQLSPVVIARDATSRHLPDTLNEPLRELGIAGLDRSLFERLATRIPSVTLREQYRMATAIADAPSRWFYAGALRAIPEVGERRLQLSEGWREAVDPSLLDRVDPSEPLVLVSHVAPPVATPHGLHPEEATDVARTAAALLALRPESAPASSWLGIISPFRAQCRAIRLALSEAVGSLADEIEVDTVERFQGREKEVMLVSLTASTSGDFVLEPRRLNVTLTRARSKVVLFGPGEVSSELAHRYGSPLCSNPPADSPSRTERGHG